MHRTKLLVAVVMLVFPVFAESDSADSRVTQSLLVEVRQLRLDLQAAAATIQRVQIAMYRIQSQIVPLERTRDRLDNIRTACTQLQEERKSLLSQPDAVPNQELVKSRLAQLAEQDQQCQTQLIDAETRFRAEQVKMSEFEDQLSKLDAALAAYGK